MAALDQSREEPTSLSKVYSLHTLYCQAYDKSQVFVAGAVAGAACSFLQVCQVGAGLA